MKNNLSNIININKEEVLRYLEYKGQEIDSNLNNTINRCIDLTKDKINPRYNLRVYPILVENNKVHIKGSNLILESNNLSDLLIDCEECILMSATLGIEIEKKIRRYSYLELSKSIIIDACATTAIESLCDVVQDNIERESLKDKKYITIRYSPGYGDLDIQVNRDIIGLLDSQKEIGLTITESGIMIPRKSVVAIIGISKNKIENKKKSCIECENYKTCKYRKGDDTSGCKEIHKK